MDQQISICRFTSNNFTPWLHDSPQVVYLPVSDLPAWSSTLLQLLLTQFLAWASFSPNSRPLHNVNENFLKQLNFRREISNGYLILDIHVHFRKKYFLGLQLCIIVNTHQSIFHSKKIKLCAGNKKGNKSYKKTRRKYCSI